jgi:AraC family transcriptional regulator, transcriptional activator of pobA
MVATSMKKIKHYDGLYGDLNHRPNADYIFSELIKTRSKGFDWVINPHLHSHLYQLFCIESGKVILDSSAKSKALQTPCILVIPPNTLHGLEYSTNVKGNILTISDSVFDKLFPTSASLVLEFETLKCIVMPPDSFEKIQLLFNEINVELFTNKTDKKVMLDSLLRQLFICLHRLVLNNGNSFFIDTNATLHYYRKFIQSVKTADKQKSIPAFAKELNITSVHLNRICNQVCGKPALLIVQENLIEQAKNYLSHTSYTIAEIAYLLNFEYPNYFARLFKKLNGVTPKEYRSKL